MKKITLILKDSLEHLPPIQSACKHLNDLGFSLSVICENISDTEREDFLRRGIHLVILSQPPKYPTKIGTALRWLHFQKNAWKAIEKNSADLYWIGSADTALALGKRILKLPYVFHVHELYDMVPLYRKRLGVYMQHAKRVFVPEQTRAHIFRAWYQLKNTPTVLPNKTYNHPRQRCLEITDPGAAKAFSLIPTNTKKIFYQGWIASDRNFLSIAQAISDLKDKVSFVIQGKVLDKEYYNRLKECNCYFIPFVNSPRHLQVTSNADIGLVFYNHSSLNNEFCAPNKIWEYSGFGLPMLGNDVLGLVNSVGKTESGIFKNLENMSSDQIREIIEHILCNYDMMSTSSKSFFESCNIKDILFSSIDSL